jgi:ABC-type nitrate/sulfonate/bicarbonate transport system permease component
MILDRILKILLPILLIVIIFISWEFLSKTGVINSALFSFPSEILRSIFNSPDIFSHVVNSLYRLIIAVAIGYLLGFIAGIMISNLAHIRFLEDIVSFFMSIPGIAWAPVFVLWLGFGDITIISVGVISAFFPVVYNIIHGSREIKQDLLHLSDLLNYNSLQKLHRVRIPSIMNYLLIALKLSFARTWRTIIAVEMIAATMFGLGYMIYDARELLNSKVMFIGIFLSGFIYLLIENLFIHLLEKQTVLKWGMKKKL